MGRVPKVRFAGFTDPWEQRKLGDLLKYEQPQPYIVDGTEYSDEYPTPVLTAGQSFVLGYTDETNDIKQASKDSPVIIFDDFTTSSHLVDFPFKIKSSAMKLLTLRDETDDFIFALNTLKSISFTPQGHERHWISKFVDFTVLVPSSVEQKAVGTFFATIDNLITLHQREHDKLTTLKKSMLERMFPRDGADVPELRFAGFTDPWEQRKLGEVATRFDNLRVPVTAKDRIPGTTPYYGANGVQDYVQGYTHKGEYVLIAEDGATNLDDYPVQLISGLSWVNNHAHVIQACSDVADNTYLMYAIKSSDISSVLVGGTRAKLNAEVLMNIELLLPKTEEQKRIGDFVMQLDDLITLHQRELALLRHAKSSMLERMFV